MIEYHWTPSRRGDRIVSAAMVMGTSREPCADCGNSIQPGEYRMITKEDRAERHIACHFYPRPKPRRRLELIE